LLKALHYPDLGICFDTGHAHLMSSVHQAYGVLQERIRSTHVHDNHRDRDSHLWPGEGTIDWNDTVQALRSAPQSPVLLMEIEGADGIDVAARMAETFKKLEAVATVTE
jgi:sugar phosphate isomerase/epimerase